MTSLVQWSENHWKTTDCRWMLLRPGVDGLWRLYRINDDAAAQGRVAWIDCDEVSANWAEARMTLARYIIREAASKQSEQTQEN
jgi:hypothetical protein